MFSAMATQKAISHTRSIDLTKIYVAFYWCELIMAVSAALTNTCQRTTNLTIFLRAWCLTPKPSLRLSPSALVGKCTRSLDKNWPIFRPSCVIAFSLRWRRRRQQTSTAAHAAAAGIPIHTDRLKYFLQQLQRLSLFEQSGSTQILRGWKLEMQWNRSTIERTGFASQSVVTEPKH